MRPLFIRCLSRNQRIVVLSSRGLAAASSTEAADVVVCGGGITGASVAYHLARRGKKVFLFEKDRIGSGGATGVSAGLVTAPVHWQDASKQFMAKVSMNLYADLASTSNFRFHRCGRVYLANSDSSEISLKRMFARAAIHKEPAELLTDPGEIFRRWPMLQTDDIKFALFSPNDSSLDSAGLCQALMDRAKQLGVHVFEHCSVRKVSLDGSGQVCAVTTDHGVVETDRFVDASGIWCGNLFVKGLPSHRVCVAAYPGTFSFMSMGRLTHPGVNNNTPIFTHVDDKIFIRPSEQRTVCGGFVGDLCKPLPVPHQDLARWTVPDADWDNFYSTLTKLLRRCADFGNMECGELICNAESWTPDKNPVLGETSQARGYFVASGMSGQGLALAGGLGDLVADVVCGVLPKVDVSRMDVQRFTKLHANSQYLLERIPEVAGRLFTNSYEYHQYISARSLRMSPIFHQMKDVGAVFGEVMGYERPLWFADKSEKREALYRGQHKLIGYPEWFYRVAKEYEACRERVGIIDMSSFSKFDVSGPDSLKLLERLCSSGIDQPVGTTIYTGIQNHDGGYVTDCMINRMGLNHFFIVAPTVQQLRLQQWMARWIREWNYNVYCQDVTGVYTALDIVGPSSRHLMRDLTGRPMTSAAFPTFSVRELSIGIASGIIAISTTHCGELGWIIYIPNEISQNVYGRIVESGQEYSLTHAGYYAYRTMRIERFFVYWGQDINTKVTPIECGRTFMVDFDKDFIGKAALLKQVETGVHKRFVQLMLNGHNIETDPWPQGGEVIFRDGTPCGRTTSATYGFTLACQVCLGYIESPESIVSPEYISKGNYEVDVAGKRFSARINQHSPSLPVVSSENPARFQAAQ